MLRCWPGAVFARRIVTGFLFLLRPLLSVWALSEMISRIAARGSANSCLLRGLRPICPLMERMCRIICSRRQRSFPSCRCFIARWLKAAFRTWRASTLQKKSAQSGSATLSMPVLRLPAVQSSALSLWPKQRAFWELHCGVRLRLKTTAQAALDCSHFRRCASGCLIRQNARTHGASPWSSASLRETMSARTPANCFQCCGRSALLPGRPGIFTPPRFLIGL